MRPALLLLTCFLLAAFAKAQDEKWVKAVVLDSSQLTPLEKCIITVASKKPAVKTLTDDKGHFSIKLKEGQDTILIQHVGFISKTISTSSKEKIDTIYLSPVEELMENIVIKTKLPPVVIHNDTTDFNIDSSMFEPYDVAEDLMKRISGLEIDGEGKMTYQGKPITRILVDGEDIFGGDPNFSLKKIPAGMVAKIQVMDTKTLEQVFNNLPVDGDDKTLNIQLKKGNKSFASAEAMLGTKNTALGSLSISQFDDARRINLTSFGNSNNRFNFPSVIKGPSNSSSNAGISYGNKWGGLRFNGNYSYNGNGNTNDMYRERTQNITADTGFFIRNNNHYDFQSKGHRFALSGNWFIDSTSTLDISFSYGTTKSKSQNNSSSTTMENGSLRNESYGKSSTTGDYESLSASLYWQKRLNKKGRSISINTKWNGSNQNTTLLNQSTNTYFKGGSPVSGDTLDRSTKTLNNTNTYSVNVAYGEPITKDLRLSLQGTLDFNKGETMRSVYNLDSTTHSAEYDSLYSAKIISTSNTQNLSASLSYYKKKWNINSGLSTVMQQTFRNLQQQEIQQNLLRYAPSVSASYALTKEKVFRAAFSASTQQPNIEQLQPVPDNSNPLYIRLGNPNLRTAFLQNYSLSYNYANVDKMVSGGINYAPVSNQIVNAVYYDEFRRQTSRYINVDGVYSLRSNLSYTKNYRKDKTTKGWSASSNFSLGQLVYFQSNSQYYSRNYSTNGTVSFYKRQQIARPRSYNISLSSTYSCNWTPANTAILNTSRLNIAPKIEGSVAFKQWIYGSASYQLWYNRLDYHSTLRNDDEYSIHNVNANLNLQFKKRYSVQTAFTYYYNTQTPEGSNKGMPSLNINASARVFKNGRGLVELSAMNLLSPNNDFRRTVGENFIEDVQTITLRNFFTLKFQYSFNMLEKKAAFERTNTKPLQTNL